MEGHLLTPRWTCRLSRCPLRLTLTRRCHKASILLWLVSFCFFSPRLDLVLNLSPPCSQPLCLSPPLNACLCAQAGAATLHGCDDFLATEKGVRMPRNLIVIPMVTLRSCRATWGIHRPTSFGTHRRKKSSKMQSNPRSDQCTPLHRKMAA